MKQVPNDMIKTLVRCLPLILDSAKPDYRDTRLINAIRQTRKQLDKLKDIDKQRVKKDRD